MPGGVRAYNPPPMKTLVVSVLSLLGGLGIGFGAQDKPQDKPQDKKAPPAEAMRMPQPEPQHKMLQACCGSWDAVVHMGGDQSKGTMTTRSVGAFYTTDEYSGTMMGMPFVGHGLNGYDPVKKKFFSVWADSFSPSPTFFWGDYDDKTKTLKLVGEMIGQDGKPAKTTSTTVLKDADHSVFTLSGPGPDGKEGEMIKIEYTRKK